MKGLNTIRKIFDVIEDGEKLSAKEIKQRVADKFNDGEPCAKTFARIKMQLVLLPRNGFMNRELVKKVFVYSKNQNTDFYSERHKMPQETVVKQVACFCKDFLICSKNVVNTSDLIRYKRMCEENFENVRFEEYTNINETEIKRVPKIAEYPRKSKAAQNKIATTNEAIGIEWYANQKVYKVESMAKELNLPLPRTRDEVIEFYKKAIKL
jgi:hypothetical protein